jgi:hypothetical protein
MTEYTHLRIAESRNAALAKAARTARPVTAKPARRSRLAEGLHRLADQLDPAVRTPRAHAA